MIAEAWYLSCSSATRISTLAVSLPGQGSLNPSLGRLIEADRSARRRGDVRGRCGRHVSAGREQERTVGAVRSWEVPPVIRRCSCGRRLLKKHRARCGQCLDREPLTVQAAPVFISCPHCTSLPGWRRRTCCQCRGERLVELSVYRSSNVWGRRGCECETCLVLNALAKPATSSASLPEHVDDPCRSATIPQRGDRIARGA